MHLILMTRGIQQYRDLWKQFMCSQMFWFKQAPILKDDKGNFLKNDDGTYKKGPEQWTKVQGALRPIELWEYVFPSETLVYNKNLPKEYQTQTLPQVLAMLGNHNNQTIRPEVSVPAWFLRKTMGLKKIPEMPKEIASQEAQMITDKYVPSEAVAVYPIGIKEDAIKDHIFKDVGFFQEGL